MITLSVERLLYLVASVLFIIGLKFLSHRKRARRGNQLAAIGLAFAIVASFIFIWGGGVLKEGSISLFLLKFLNLDVSSCKILAESPTKPASPQVKQLSYSASSSPSRKSGGCYL